MDKRGEKPGDDHAGPECEGSGSAGKDHGRAGEDITRQGFLSLYSRNKTRCLKEPWSLPLRCPDHQVKAYLLADVICVEFLATYPSGSDDFQKAEIVSKSLSRLGEAIKVKFVGEVLDSETGEIIFQKK